MKGFTLKELSELTKTEVYGDKEKFITGVDTLEEASTNDASFLANPRYFEIALKSKAGVICCQEPLNQSGNFLLSSNPSKNFQELIKLFLPPEENRSAFTSIHPTAIIHESAIIGKNVTIGPYSVIDQGVVIDESTTIYAHVFIGSNSKIGKNSLIYPHVTIRERSIIGDRVIIQPGAVIGSCGFGFTTAADGSFQKLEQLGNVIIEDDVEIGANTTIDRARFRSTIIHRGSKIDNLVQIAHNVEIGEHNGIAAQTGIAGSSKTGKHVLFGGQAGVVGHVTICDNVMLATRSGVSKSVQKPGKYRGSPVMPLEDYNRQEILIRKLVREKKIPN